MELSPAESTQFQNLIAKVHELMPQESGETLVEYFERVLEKYSWCFTVNKYIGATMRYAPIILASTNSKGEFSAITDSVTAMLGYLPAELRGQHISILTEEKQRCSVKAVFSQEHLNPTNHLFRATVQKKDGQQLSTLWDLVWSEQASIYFCTVHDLSRRSKMTHLIA